MSNFRVNMDKRILIPVFLLLIISVAFAQTSEITIEHVGYGKTSKEAVFMIRNTGETILTDITISIDRKEHETIKGILGPGKGIQKIFLLDPGEHEIEVNPLEEAYDSISITTLATKEKPPVEKEEETFFEDNKVYIGAGILIVILVIGIWLFTRKPKLE